MQKSVEGALPESANRGVSFVQIDENNHGQRLDNFLLSQLKGVPKSRIYKIVRKGEVRVNKGRIKPEYKLQTGDTVRIPPVRVANKQGEVASLPGWVRNALQAPIYEDEHIIALNKPSGLAVHGGSGTAFGVIEAMRFLVPDRPFLELAHRIDRQTSGCLLLAKSRVVLNHLHEQFRRESQQLLEKSYLAILTGAPLSEVRSVEEKIGQTRDKNGIKKGRVDAQGQQAKSVFMPLATQDHYTLVRIALKTGRMHQARVHAAFLDRPIVGDSLYGNWEQNKLAEALGVKRCLLHSESYQFTHPISEQLIKIKAPISEDFAAVQSTLFG